MIVDSMEGKLTFKSSARSSTGSLFSSECYWDGEHQLPARDAAVTTVALCCQTGEGEDCGPATLDWKLGIWTPTFAMARCCWSSGHHIHACLCLFTCSLTGLLD